MDDQRDHFRYEKAKRTLAKELGRRPTEEELTAHLAAEAEQAAADAKAAQAAIDEAEQARAQREQKDRDRRAARDEEINRKVAHLVQQDVIRAVPDALADKIAELERKEAELRQLLADPEITRPLIPPAWRVLFDAGELGPEFAPFRDKDPKTVRGAATYSRSTNELKWPKEFDIPVRRLAEGFGLDYNAMQTEGKDACYREAKRLWKEETNTRLLTLAQKHGLNPKDLIVGAY